MRKTILLNCLPLTGKKKAILDSLFPEYLRVLNLTLEQLPNAHSNTELHHLTYSNIKNTSFFTCKIIVEARKDVWAHRKTIKNGFKKCSIRLDAQSFRFFTTERGTPCFKITYSPRKSIVIPIKTDNAFNLFGKYISDEWEIKSISLLENGQIAVSIKKDYPKQTNDKRYAIGVDIGSDTLAAITILDTKTGKTIKQLYFGRDIAVKQRKYSERRSILQSYADKGSKKAKKVLERLKHKQANFVKTRSGQVAKEIVNLAIQYDAYIAIEKLNIRGKKYKYRKSTNRKITYIPYGQFKKFLISNCEKYGIPLVQIDAYNTSKWCLHCGSINEGHSSVNYALYTCKKCGLIVNSDRKASKTIAIKSALEREQSQGLTYLFSQFSNAGVAVNQLFRSNDKGISDAEHSTKPLDEKLVDSKV